MLVALFLKRGGFALIDEPTNHLDMASRQALAEYLCKKKGFILVSHDRSLIDGCVDHIMSLNRAGIEIRKGNFSEWERDKEERDKSETERNSRLKKDIERLKDAAGQAARWSDKTESSKKGKNAGRLEARQGICGTQGRENDETLQGYRAEVFKGGGRKKLAVEKRGGKRKPQNLYAGFSKAYVGGV